MKTGKAPKTPGKHKLPRYLNVHTQPSTSKRPASFAVKTANPSKNAFKAILSELNRFWMSSINQSSKCSVIAYNEAYSKSRINSSVQGINFDKYNENDSFGVVFDCLGNLIITCISLAVLLFTWVSFWCCVYGYLGRY